MNESLSFRERSHGIPEPVLDELPTQVSNALVGAITRRLDQNWFAEAFPEHCHDGNGVVGTDRAAFGQQVVAMVPGAPWPLGAAGCPDEVVFDLLEYAYQEIAEARNGRHHDHFRHYELLFDPAGGRAALRDQVNLIFRRNRIMYTMTTIGQIHRSGTDQVRAAVRGLQVATTDPVTNDLLTQAREKYQSHRLGERKEGVERLWDAYERIKSGELTDQADKKQSIAALLDRIADPTWREDVDREMHELTSLGNRYHIRHWEVQARPVPPDAMDYLYTRMSGLVSYLLQLSGTQLA